MKLMSAQQYEIGKRAGDLLHPFIIMPCFEGNNFVCYKSCRLLVYHWHVYLPLPTIIADTYS